MVIGLDGATWNLLDPWILENKLPTFKRLIKSGIKGVLKSTIPSWTSPALPSLYTGMNPGNLGVFSFIKPDGSLVSSTDIKYPTIWNILDTYNFKSCIVNIPMTFPPERLNGIMICGPYLPSYKCDYTYPKDLKRRIGLFQDEELDKEISEKLRNPKRYHQDLLEIVTKRTERRYNVFKQLNLENEYDFSFYWISGTDAIQHFCWDYKETILRFYTKVDEILGDVIETFPERNIIVLSDHGFESPAEEFFLVNTWLYRNGYLKRVGGSFFQYLLDFVQLTALRYIPFQYKEKMSKILGIQKPRQHIGEEPVLDRYNLPGAIDYSNSVAYLTTLWGIDVNCSKNYDIVRNEIIEKLKKLRDSRGERVIRAAWRKEEIFRGKYLKQIPDIVFLPMEKYHPFPLFLQKKIFFKMKGKAIGNRKWKDGSARGDHLFAREGILISSGPAIERGKMVEDIEIADIVPTVLHMMGCRIPGHVDGRVSMNLFKRESVPRQRKIQIDREKQKIETHREKSVKKEDEARILQRLRELGYL